MNIFIIILLIILSVHLILKQYTYFKKGKKINYLSLICAIICLISSILLVIFKIVGVS